MFHQHESVSISVAADWQNANDSKTGWDEINEVNVLGVIG